MKKLWFFQFLGSILAFSKMSFYKVNRANGRILNRVSVSNRQYTLLFHDSDQDYSLKLFIVWQIIFIQNFKNLAKLY